MQTTITHKEKTYNIDSDIKAKNEELVTLILNTESMDDDERQYWFDILPSMQPEQVQRLYNILHTEKVKLEELDRKYQEEFLKIHKKTPEKIETLNIDTLSDNQL